MPNLSSQIKKLPWNELVLYQVTVNLYDIAREERNLISDG